MNLLNYTNGVGHLIMSVLMTMVGVALIVIPGLPAADAGVGIGLILSVQAAWFVPGAAKQVATEVAKQFPNSTLLTVTATPVTTPTGGSNATTTAQSS